MKHQEDDKKNNSKDKSGGGDSHSNVTEDTTKKIAEMEAFFAKYREDIALCRNLILQVQEVCSTKFGLNYRISVEKSIWECITLRLERN